VSIPPGCGFRAVERARRFIAKDGEDRQQADGQSRPQWRNGVLGRRRPERKHAKARTSYP